MLILSLKKYTNLLSFLIVMVFSSCINSPSDEVFPAKVNLDNQTETYRRDKATIERTYLDNIESVRLVYRKTEGYEVNKDSVNPEIADGHWIFTPYALGFSPDDKKVAAPIRTDSRISLVVDTLTYSRDSLFCVALVIIKVKNNIIPNDEILKDSCCYDGRAIIGMRKKKECPFYLYPINVWISLGSLNYSIARRELRKFYFNRIEGFSYWEGKYKCGIGDPEFFNSAPDFKKDSLGFYLFESFTDMGKRYQYYNYKE